MRCLRQWVRGFGFRAALYLFLGAQAPAALAAQPEHVAQVRAAQKSAYLVSGSPNGCQRTEEYAQRGWAGAVVKLCQYALFDKGLNAKRRGIAYLLEIEPVTIADWIEDACAQLTEPRPDCFGRLLGLARDNSGLMFPVAGNVVEDMERPGFFKNYIFLNGVTVAPDLKVNGSAQPLNLMAQQTYARVLPNQLAGIRTGKARFWSTLPSQVEARFPDLGAPARLNVADANERWLDLVRREMLTALGSMRNRLVEAYLCANAGALFSTTCRAPREI